MDVYKVNDEWLQQCKQFNVEIEQGLTLPHWVESVRAELALRGGWRMGYTWAGNFRVTVRGKTYGRLSTAPEFRGYASSLEGVRRVIDKASVVLGPQCSRLMLVTLHRDMLKDKRASKRHSKILQSKYGSRWHWDQEAVAAGHNLLGRLLRRRGWGETILGFETPDGRLYDDLGILTTDHNPGWVDPA